MWWHSNTFEFVIWFWCLVKSVSISIAFVHYGCQDGCAYFNFSVSSLKQILFKLHGSVVFFCYLLWHMEILFSSNLVFVTLLSRFFTSDAIFSTLARFFSILFCLAFTSNAVFYVFPLQLFFSSKYISTLIEASPIKFE